MNKNIKSTITLELDREELEAIRFALVADYETVSDNEDSKWRVPEWDKDKVILSRLLRTIDKVLDK